MSCVTKLSNLRHISFYRNRHFPIWLDTQWVTTSCWEGPVCIVGFANRLNFVLLIFIIEWEAEVKYIVPCETGLVYEMTFHSCLPSREWQLARSSWHSFCPFQPFISIHHTMPKLQLRPTHYGRGTRSRAIYTYYLSMINGHELMPHGRSELISFNYISGRCGK